MSLLLRHLRCCPRKISGLDTATGLRELNLSYNFISRIENLDSLASLTDLNLAENNIRRVHSSLDSLLLLCGLATYSHPCDRCSPPRQIENLEALVHLQRLNLSGNQIRGIPEAVRSLSYATSLVLLYILTRCCASRTLLDCATCLSCVWHATRYSSLVYINASP